MHDKGSSDMSMDNSGKEELNEGSDNEKSSDKLQESSDKFLSRRDFLKSFVSGAVAVGGITMLPSVSAFQITSDNPLQYFNQSSSDSSFEVDTSGTLEVNQIGTKSSPVSQVFTDRVGDGSNPLTRLETEKLSKDIVFLTSDYLKADGSTDDADSLQSAIENEEGKLLILEEDSGVINLDSQVNPTTSGQKTVIYCVGEPTLDVTDISGVNSCITFQNADNIEIKGKLRVKNDTGTGILWSLTAGNGFRFDTIELDTGQGGFNTGSHDDIKGDEIIAKGHRDTDSGEAPGFHSLGATGAEISRVEVKNCDRGVEIEDDTQHMNIETVRAENISNQSAGSPSTQKSVDITAHSNTTVDDINLGDVHLVDCDVGVGVIESGGKLGSVNISRIIEEDSGTYSPQASFQGADTVIGSYNIRNPETARPNGVVMKSGSLTISRLNIEDPVDFRGVLVQGGENLSITEQYSIEAVSEGTDKAVEVQTDSNLDHLHIDNLDVKGSLAANTVEVGGNGVTGTDRWGVVMRDADLAKGGGGVRIDISNTGNTPCFLDGVNLSGGANVLPDGSVVKGAKGRNASDFSGAVAVNGVGTESANAEKPQLNWEEGTTVKFTDSGDDSGTGIYRLIEGNWIQLN